ncbi:MAG: ATP-dependent Clp protease proteolytic subunit [Planctomycetes bacterium RIFCSPHIGHO2_12_FULL_52_36]|nr:MAG: ATP-dependent Clp protease proteolytic subunit [Planctomycetes bacterium RIFCSPHIGHO2_02_FULL_52_58]OHB94290.1 MAG: ATP-dependent Clp protease proteolytic subunit [Planctomycetes bacterium RIFCSPHIGHO2_12_FULL_52_36]
MTETPIPHFQEEEEEEEKEERPKRAMDFNAKLLKTRTVVVADVINKKMAQQVIGQLLLLEQEDPKKDIKIFINSPGGDADAGFAIYDMMRFIRPKVKAVCTGITASAAVIILLGAAKEDRYSMPNARILIHQPSTGVMGTAADIQIEAGEIIKFRDKINRLIAQETGQSIEKVENDTRRNFWMTGEEALRYGLVSKIVNRREEME